MEEYIGSKRPEASTVLIRRGKRETRSVCGEIKWVLIACLSLFDARYIISKHQLTLVGVTLTSGLLRLA